MPVRRHVAVAKAHRRTMASPTWMAAAGHMAAAAEDKAAAAERKRRESIGQIGKRPEKIPRKAGELHAILAQYLDNPAAAGRDLGEERGGQLARARAGLRSRGVHVPPPRSRWPDV